MSRIKRKPIRNKTEALKEQLLYEKKVSKTFERATVRLKEQVNELEAEAAGLREAVEKLQRDRDIMEEIIRGQKDRIFKMIVMLNEECLKAGLTNKDIGVRYSECKCDGEIRPAAEPVENIFEQSGENKDIYCRHWVCGLDGKEYCDLDRHNLVNCQGLSDKCAFRAEQKEHTDEL